jgi:beta-galactosidase
MIRFPVFSKSGLVIFGYFRADKNETSSCMLRTKRRFLLASLLLMVLPVISVIGRPEEAGVSRNPELQEDFGGPGQGEPRERINLNRGWRFFKYGEGEVPDGLIYDERPATGDFRDGQPADARPKEAMARVTSRNVLKPWILPTANPFIGDRARHHVRPEGDPGMDFPFTQVEFDDRSWEMVDLPHDWAIGGPFQEGGNSEVGGGMGRLPVNGVAWYRRKLDIPASDAGKSFFLEIDGAMSYAMVWVNGRLAGGWPYGYASWQLDLTPWLVPGGENQLAIRLDNPNHSSRWYPGAGLYRNVWLTKTQPLRVAPWGAFISTEKVSETAVAIHLDLTIDNNSPSEKKVQPVTRFYFSGTDGNRAEAPAALLTMEEIRVAPGRPARIRGSVILENPRLWGPPPSQLPWLYVAETTLRVDGQPVDRVETRFGIREVTFHPDSGIFINGEKIRIKGVNLHHDLGALGGAFHVRAAERQLEILREMGCNAIRMAHNPPAPELLALTDRMGFLVIDEIFDSWERNKTPHDFHLIFPEWSEADTRAFIRRDRNSPSVIIWSFGNEVGEQYTGEAGAAVARRLQQFIREEDPTRPTILAMNYAKPHMELPEVPDIIGLNYQGEGIRQEPEYEGTDRIRTAPQYEAFHTRHPGKVILSTETASAFSSRGVFLFPVSDLQSAPVRDGRGGDSKSSHVTSYELHAVDFGASPEKVFASLEKHPFVAGEFVWTGWDHLGEPTPYYDARSSYSGIIDLAGFRKERFYLYQSHWRPDLPMAHLLPHWNWPERTGETTPVHLFTSGDEAELFLNGKSLGRKKKGEFEYRLRWDEVVFEAGELKAIAYRKGKPWAEDVLKTTGGAKALKACADRSTIIPDGKDLSFITVEVTDRKGRTVPRSSQTIHFSLRGQGEIVATDNGDPTDMDAFSSHSRKAFNGMALAIVRFREGARKPLTLIVQSPGLKKTRVRISPGATR